MKDSDYEVVPTGDGHYTVFAIRPVWIAEFSDKNDAVRFAAQKAGEGDALASSGLLAASVDAPSTPAANDVAAPDGKVGAEAAQPPVAEARTREAVPEPTPVAKPAPNVEPVRPEAIPASKTPTQKPSPAPTSVELDDPVAEEIEREPEYRKPESETISGNELLKALEMQGSGMNLKEIAAEMGKSFVHLRGSIARYKKDLKNFPKTIRCRRCKTPFQAENPTEVSCDACLGSEIGAGA